ncbi:antiterminator Q family protein [Erwinia typographi]|uniref:antiterminator Q family protein n=1 Tax=Erwinia typographi TaxID=371042 RepID=UPI001E5DBF80|nr:antiterminator Q family protein [Erwinia typographi]
MAHYTKTFQSGPIGRKLKLSEGMIRIKFQTAEEFIEGCLSNWKWIIKHRKI